MPRMWERAFQAKWKSCEEAIKWESLEFDMFKELKEYQCGCGLFMPKKIEDMKLKD